MLNTELEKHNCDHLRAIVYISVCAYVYMWVVPHKLLLSTAAQWEPNTSTDSHKTVETQPFQALSWSIFCQTTSCLRVFGFPLGSPFSWYHMHCTPSSPTDIACLWKMDFSQFALPWRYTAYPCRSSAPLRICIKVAAVMGRWERAWLGSDIPPHSASMKEA